MQKDKKCASIKSHVFMFSIVNSFIMPIWTCVFNVKSLLKEYYKCINYKTTPYAESIQLYVKLIVEVDELEEISYIPSASSSIAG